MQSFESQTTPDPVTYVPILAEGRKALDRINSEWGLGMDEDDIKYYTGLFKDKMKRCVLVTTRRCEACFDTQMVAVAAETLQTSRCLTSGSQTPNTVDTGFSRGRS